MPTEPDNEGVHRRPTLIKAGRRDALVPVNNSARAYTAFDRAVEGASSQLGFLDVGNAQHVDAFLPFWGFDTRFVPLHACLNQAINSRYARLTANTALPGSPVVHATPRVGHPGAAPALRALNVPPHHCRPALRPGCVNLGSRSDRLNASSWVVTREDTSSRG